jgi:microcystin-dependent protein
MTVVISGTSGVTFPDSITQSQAAVLTGAVTFFAMSTAPSGWLKANGDAVSRTTYATLFAAIGTTFGTGDGSTTFNLPDMRGYFARGWVDNGSIDSGRVFGSTQADAFASHTHTLSNGATLNSSVNNGGLAGTQSKVGFSNVSSATGGTETRPVNVALLACIKY